MQLLKWLMSLFVFEGLGRLGYRKALFACSTVYLLTLINWQAFGHVRFIRVLLRIVGEQRASLLISSNHFVLSLEIVFFLSMLLVILLHTFKLAKPVSAS